MNIEALKARIAANKKEKELSLFTKKEIKNTDLILYDNNIRDITKSLVRPIEDNWEYADLIKQFLRSLKHNCVYVTISLDIVTIHIKDSEDSWYIISY